MRTVLVFLLCCLPGFFDEAVAALQAKHVGTLAGGLDQPCDVAISDTGRVYVLDGVNDRVLVFSPKGKREFSFGEKAGLSQPMGIAIDGKRMYIADSGNHRIAIFNLRGGFIKQLALSGERPPEPVALTVAEGVISWSDRRNHRVCRTEAESGKEILCWGGRGEGEGRFQFPFQIKPDRDGYLHVVDVLNGRVQGFNTRGRYFGQTGRFGLGAGELFRPNGLAFHGRELLVSDGYQGTISVFRDGEFVGLLTNERDEPLALSVPVALAVWRERLYVVDTGRNRVEIFRLSPGEEISPVARSGERREFSQKQCVTCHLDWAKDYLPGEGGQDSVPPVATEGMCYSCHHGAVIDSRRAIGRGSQHPDVHHQRKTKQSSHKDRIPDVFPVLPDDQLYCGSCHTPHTMINGQADTLYVEHNNPWVRVLNNDGDLCQRCHESKFASTLDNDHPPTGVNHPVGIYLKAPPVDQTKGFARSEKLQQGLPQVLLDRGLSLGGDRQMICQSCHQIHGAKNAALIPFEYENGQLCAQCHERQHARDKKEAREKGIHPVNIELEKPVMMGDQEIKRITCLTCHSLHDGEEGTVLLTFNNRDGQLCSYCHEKYDAVVNSDHDLRNTAENYENRLHQRPEASGACGVCHTMHQGNAEAPFLYAGEYQPYEGEVLARDRLCLDCHRNKGVAEKAVIEHFSHPSRDVALRSDPAVMPLLNGGDEIAEFGVIACITCHDPHRWHPKADKLLTPGANQEGNVLNSFLRRKGAKGTFCVTCHGVETPVKYKYFHDKRVRNKGIEYLK